MNLLRALLALLAAPFLSSALRPNPEYEEHLAEQAPDTEPAAMLTPAEVDVHLSVS